MKITRSYDTLILALWLLAAATICAVSVAVHLVIGLDNDTLLLTRHAAKMLDGGKAYIDFADVDPPLIYLFFTVPVMLSRALSLPMHIALNSFDLFLCAVSLGVTWMIVQRSQWSVRARLVLISAVALALLTVSFAHQVFADREHWVVVLIAPWLVLRAPDMRRENVPARWRIAVAVLAGLGFAVKPYAYAIYLASLGLQLLNRDSARALLRQPEQFIIGGIGLFYVCAVVLWFPEYLTQVLPVMVDTYRPLSWPLNSKWGVITHDMLHNSLVWLVALPLLWWRNRPGCDRTFIYLGLLMLGCIAAFVMGGGWFYTQYPFMAVSFVTAIVAGGRLVGALGGLVRLAVCGALVAGLWYSYGMDLLWRLNSDIQRQALLARPLDQAVMPDEVWAQVQPELAAHPKFLWLGIDLWAANLIHGAVPWQSVGRFDYLWMLPGTLEVQATPGREADFARLAAYMGTSIADDIERHRPDMVIQDISPVQHLLPQSYDVLPLLLGQPRFAKAWKNYVPGKVINLCTPTMQADCAYRFYIRKNL